MSIKKSYMSTKNILNEDFFTNMGRIGAIIRGLRKSKKKKLKKDKNVNKVMKNLNSSVSELEKYYTDLYDKKIKLDRFSIKDFI